MWQTVNRYQYQGSGQDLVASWEQCCGCTSGVMYSDSGRLEMWQGEAELTSLRAGQYSTPNKDTKGWKKDGGVCAPTFLDFLRWLFLLDELGCLLWKFQLLPVTSHLCNGLNTSYKTGRGNALDKWYIWRKIRIHLYRLSFFFSKCFIFIVLNYRSKSLIAWLEAIKLWGQCFSLPIQVLPTVLRFKLTSLPKTWTPL